LTKTDVSYLKKKNNGTAEATSRALRFWRPESQKAAQRGKKSDRTGAPLYRNRAPFKTGVPTAESTKKRKAPKGSSLEKKRGLKVREKT